MGYLKKKDDKQSDLNCKVEGEVHVTRWSKSDLTENAFHS